MFELVLENENIRVVDEKHYQLVSRENINDEDLRRYQIYET
jgi:hypothetical protein